MPKRKTANEAKAPKRARTRATLLKATFDLVIEKGFAAVTLDDVAARAGMTRGAIYGNFEDREDLMLAMVLANSRPLGEVEFGDNLRSYLRNVGRRVASVTTPGAGIVSFHAYAVTNPNMIERLTDHLAELFKLREAELEAAFPGHSLPLQPGQFAAVMQALTMGIMYQRLISRGLMSDDSIVAAFEALASL